MSYSDVMMIYTIAVFATVIVQSFLLWAKHINIAPVLATVFLWSPFYFPYFLSGFNVYDPGMGGIIFVLFHIFIMLSYGIYFLLLKIRKIDDKENISNFFIFGVCATAIPAVFFILLLIDIAYPILWGIALVAAIILHVFVWGVIKGVHHIKARYD